MFFRLYVVAWVWSDKHAHSDIFYGTARESVYTSIKTGTARRLGVPRTAFEVVLGTAKFWSTGADFETNPLRLHAGFWSAMPTIRRHGCLFFCRAVPKAMSCKRGFKHKNLYSITFSKKILKKRANVRVLPVCTGMYA